MDAAKAAIGRAIDIVDGLIQDELNARPPRAKTKVRRSRGSALPACDQSSDQNLT